jgi:D-aminopeptidase
VGQHAKARSELAHIAHTQSFGYLDFSINRVSVGEFGEMVFCASQLGIPTIFGAGDLAFTKEAQALVPGIETVSVKRGNRPGRGDECSADAYGKRNLGAIHKSPRRVRELIREGAARAVQRAKTESFGLIEVKPPFERVAIFRHTETSPRLYCRETHPTDVCELLNLPYDRKRVESEEQLKELLSD